ncbi:MAG: DUF3137 domain-containing protein [Alphaproteobacteria bacterium]
MTILYEKEPAVLTGINGFAEREIFPRLRQLGGRPKQEVRKQKAKFLAIGVAAILILSYLIAGGDGMIVLVPILTPFVGGIVYLIYRISKGPTAKTERELMDIVPGGIARHLGLSLKDEGGEDFARECMKVGCVGDFDDISVQFFLTGTLGDNEVRCALVSMGDDTTGTVSDFSKSGFVGSLYSVRTGKKMRGRTLLMPQMHIGNFLNKYSAKFSETEDEKFEAVDWGEPDFKARFAVYSSNPDGAKSLLNGVMQDRLVKAVTDVPKLGASAALADGTIYLAVLDGKPRRLHPKFKENAPADDPEPVRAVADAMAEIVGRLKAMAD